MKSKSTTRSSQVTRSDIKLVGRYVVIAFFMYLSWFIVQPNFIASVKGLGDIGIGAIYTSILGALAYIVKTNWTSAPKE